MWGGRKKRGWGASWTMSKLSASTPTSGRLQPRTRGDGPNGRTRDETFYGEIDRCRENQSWATACSGMPKRDGKDQEEDNSKQAGSCWFARPCRLATSGANLYPPGVSFEDAMASFSCALTFVLFCFASFTSLCFH